MNPQQNNLAAAPVVLSLPWSVSMSMHGCLCEVAFTAVCDWCSTRDRKLAGHSILCALPMYATAIYLMEGLRVRLLAQRLLRLPTDLTARRVSGGGEDGGCCGAAPSTGFALLLFRNPSCAVVWWPQCLAVIPRVRRAPNSNSPRSSKGRKGV
ncbi:unnamed protein product [Pleuronectes platessa]|uniref:Uncharacterized protein n=1 Tax=Pleuronectes platessa TaxID=8262 RepID=A0A9N7UVT1_PLEPL|nr:unnamed protein product [Pleuronectes platessa]